MASAIFISPLGITFDGSLFTLLTGALGIELNIGVAVPTFNNGTLASKSNNVCGAVQLTGGNTGGTLTFGLPNFTNTPFVVIAGSAATDVPQVTARSTSAFTVAGITANGLFTYLVIGGR